MLEQELKSDITERQKSLLQIKTLYVRYHFKEDDEDLFLNYSIPAVYAIWEGFIQTSFQAYIQELNKLNLHVNTICKPLLVHHMESTFKQFIEYPKKISGKVGFYEKLNQFYQSEFIDITRTVNTESNVGFQVLNRILTTFNLDKVPEYSEPRYSVKQELEKFLTARNSLAHGQNSITIGRKDLDRAIKLIEILMELVFDKIIEGFKKKSYLS